MRILTYIALICTTALHSFGEKNKEATVTTVFEQILSNAQSVEERKNKSSNQIPHDFTNEKLYQLAVRLKSANWDLDTYGDKGITYIETAFSFCLYELSQRTGGENHLVALLENRKLGWDAGHSIILGDAIVKRGKPCLPLLRALSDGIPHKSRYIDLIEKGIKTNI